MENTSKKPEVPGRIRDVRVCTNGAKAFFLKLRNGGFPKKRLPCDEGFQRNASKCKLVLAVYDTVVSIENFLSPRDFFEIGEILSLVMNSSRFYQLNMLHIQSTFSLRFHLLPYNKPSLKQTSICSRLNRPANQSLQPFFCICTGVSPIKIRVFPNQPGPSKGCLTWFRL